MRSRDAFCGGELRIGGTELALSAYLVAGGSVADPDVTFLGYLTSPTDAAKAGLAVCGRLEDFSREATRLNYLVNGLCGKTLVVQAFAVITVLLRSPPTTWLKRKCELTVGGILFRSF